MKICPCCENRFGGEVWRCRRCGWEADRGGFVKLAKGEGGFDAEHFERLKYAEESCFWFSNRNQVIVSVVDRLFPEADSFMEVGCGTGFVLSAIASARPWKVLVGAEISEDGLRIARDRVPHADLIQMNACQCGFEEEFDLVGAFDVVEHIEDDVVALENLSRAILPNGGLILTVPQHPWLWSRQDEIAGHYRRYSHSELVTKLRRVGLEVAYATSFTTLLLPLLIFSRFRSRWGKARPEAGTLCELSLPRAVDRALGLASLCERSLLRNGITFPMGGSLLVAAQKAC